jgi:hypothetical protein
MHSGEVLWPKTLAAIVEEAGMSPAELAELL